MRMEQTPSKQEELRNRTKRFALRIIRLFRHLPRSTEAQVLGKQLLRSGNLDWSELSGGRTREVESIFEMNSVGIVVEEADEAVFLD